MFDINDLKSIRISLASPEKIRSWSHGEVKKFETINYRSQKPEMGGLFCEKIFGPSKDYECHCGKYKKIRYQGVVCEKCGVEVISKEVRRERMGHIELASPVTHIWYLKSVPSRIGLVLDIPAKQLEEIIYFAAHVVLNPGNSKILYKYQYLSEKNGPVEFIAAINGFIDTLDKDSYDYTRATELIKKLENYPQEPFDFQTTAAFISKHTGAEFGEGAEAIKRLLQEINLDEESAKLRAAIKDSKKDKQKKLMKRLAVIEAFRSSGNRPEWMVLDCIPVLPPDLRPMCKLEGGRFAVSDLNELYRRVITRNNRLKRLIDMAAPSVILLNEKRMVQEAVDALIDNGRRNKPVQGPNGRTFKCLTSILKGKQGRFRQNLLGKRVDYSGRAVIVIGPELKMYQCGVPKQMALELFKPFIMKRLVEINSNYNIKSAKRMVDREVPIVWDVLDEVIKDHPVLLNRAPTLHKLSIQAFEPVLVEGNAIKLHPLVCTGFNADFDGDQMAIHLPLSIEAKAEARFLMLASNNIVKPSDGSPVVTPQQDIVLGSYYLTMVRPGAKGEGRYFIDEDEVMMAYQLKQIDMQAPIYVRKKGVFEGKEVTSRVQTTAGRIIFNRVIPQDLGYVDRTKRETCLDYEISFPTGKDQLGKIVGLIYEKYGTTPTAKILDEIKTLGYKYSTLSGITMNIFDMDIPKERETIINDTDKLVADNEKMYKRGLITLNEKQTKNIELWEDATQKVSDAVRNNLGEFNPIKIIAVSKARTNPSQLNQVCGMRGPISSTSGEKIDIPIKSNYRLGLTSIEYFMSSRGGRKGLADVAMKTADAGYLTRRLVDVAHDVVVVDEDCFATNGEKVKGMKVSAVYVDQTKVISLADRIVGRYTVNDIINPKTNELIAGANTMLSKQQAKAVEEAGIQEVEIRTALTCKSKHGICQKCYGKDMSNDKVVALGEAVGIIAAQSIGEPGTQLTMRNFHTGGVSTASDITTGLPRVEELFEARKPKGLAVISEVSGPIKINKLDKLDEVVVKTSEGDVSYVLPYGSSLAVKEGDRVDPGTPLTKGSIYPNDILRTRGVKYAQEYLLNEILYVYSRQSVNINPKHLEVIIRQMLRKVKIEESGSTNLLPGAYVDVNTFEEENLKVLQNGGIPASAKPMLLGITKASLSTESFLSAASFQETSSVLTEAAIRGKVDYLQGIKENVIIGKLIPAGTGLKQYRDLMPKEINDAFENNVLDEASIENDD